MKVKVAKVCGFCSGVKRAVKLASSISGFGHTFGPIIHNKDVISMLDLKGVSIIDSVCDLKFKKVVLRAHGVAKSVFDELSESGCEIIDGTCPLVKNVRDVALDFEKNGYHVVVYGDELHSEVKGIVSYLSNYSVFLEVPDVSVFDYDKVAIVSQTTRDLNSFDDFVLKFRKICKEVVYKNTICDATKKRQECAKKLANFVDVMVVIGDFSSSNTKRLYEICEKIVLSYQVENKNRLKDVDFSKFGCVGVTAGASVPDFIIDDIVLYLKNL
jgi:4-hydroxy-3-methylbut-2-en-1-yl diphosphate reductase